MRLYRISKEQYLEIYNGRGGSYSDGARWNLPGTPVLYFSLSASVAMLEMANYTSSPRMFPPSSRLGVYELSDDSPISKIEIKDLPEDWAQYPYPQSTQSIGDKWLQAGKELGLIVPSCAVPGGLGEIMVVNPSHKEIETIKLVETHANFFNERAFAGR
jgi:RES domain-containing protein